MHKQLPSHPPRSVVGWFDSFLGIAAVVALFFYLRHSDLSDEALSVLLVVAFAAVLALIELRRAPWRRAARTHIPFNEVLQRSAFKLMAFAATLAAVAFLYWLIPEYHREYYARFFTAALLTLPYFLLAAIPYFVYLEWRLPREEGGMWHTSVLLRGRWREADRAILAQYALGWLAKGFFLPIMFADVVNIMGTMRVANWDLPSLGFVAAFNLLLPAIIRLELVFVTAGYAFTCRLFDTHIRRVEHTLFGWTVTVISYTPFLGLIYGQYLNYADGAAGWLAWLGAYPAIAVAWGSVIIILLALHLWSDACFGVRFSNLTNRGIITNGPYRFCKHPAYVIKSVRWLMVSVPFIAASPLEGLRLTLLLLGVFALYAVRSYAEERLLSRDPVYVAYAQWMERHSLLRFLRRVPLFSYEWRLARWQRQRLEVYSGHLQPQAVEAASLQFASGGAGKLVR